MAGSWQADPKTKPSGYGRFRKWMNPWREPSKFWLAY